MIAVLVAAIAPFASVNPSVCTTVIRHPEDMVQMLQQQEPCPLFPPTEPGYDVVCPEGYHKDWPCYMTALNQWTYCVSIIRAHYCELAAVSADEHNQCLRDAYNAYQACLTAHPGDPTGVCLSTYYAAIQDCDDHYYQGDLALLLQFMQADINATCTPTFIHDISTCCTKN